MRQGGNLVRTDVRARMEARGRSIHPATVVASHDNGAVAIERTRRVRVAIVAAERLFREALRMLLASDDGLHVVGHAAQWTDGATFAEDPQPHVIVFDPCAPDRDPVDAISRITRQTPASKVLLLTASRDSRELCRALKAGARGYVSKDAGLSDLTKAIRGVHEGEVWAERRLIGDLLADVDAAPSQPPPQTCGLTAREQEILRLLASGGTNRHIGQMLFISEKTVKTHLKNIFRKLHVTRRLQAVLYAVGQGLREP